MPLHFVRAKVLYALFPADANKFRHLLTRIVGSRWGRDRDRVPVQFRRLSKILLGKMLLRKILLSKRLH